MTDLVFKGQNGQVLTNSLLVAEKFGKRHADVIEALIIFLIQRTNHSTQKCV